jgi:hypothetical protein
LLKRQARFFAARDFLAGAEALLRLAARAARAFTRFCASLARASGDSGRRFFATFLTAGLVGALDDVREPRDVVGRPTAGATLTISAPSPPSSFATIAA